MTREIELGGLAELENEPPLNWLIPGWLPARELALLVGKPGMYKSFIALGWSLYLSSQGHPVLYMAAEGLSGIRPRVDAWRARWNKWRGLDWHYMKPNVYLNDSVERAVFTGAIMQYFRDRRAEITAHLEPGHPDHEGYGLPDLIVVDTLDRNYNGEENSTREIGYFIDGLEELRQDFNTAILVIHHLRKDGDVERGSTALPAAMFATLQVSRPQKTNMGMSVGIEATKMKDGPVPEPGRLDLAEIELKHDKYGECYESSLALAHAEPRLSKQEEREVLKDDEQVADFVRTRGEVSGDDFSRLTGISKRNANQILHKNPLLKGSDGVYTVRNPS